MKFNVNLATGVVTGPADYLASESFRETKRKIENGTHVLIGASPSTPLGILLAVIFQTDYAAWEGMRRFVAR